MTQRSFQKFSQRLRATELYLEVSKRSLAHHVTLRDLYEGPDRAPSVVTARRAVYTWLKEKKGYGVREVARLFDRAANGVSKLTRNGK